jgi:energy-coupling factor transporter ATP-binding protein EcfA2
MKIADIAVQVSERGLLVGETGTGKSTLANVFLNHWAETDKDARILLIDTKPRFRAEYQLSGKSATPLYKNWRQGVTIPYSYRLPIGASGKDLRNAWEIVRTTTPPNRGLTIIAQVPINQHAAQLYYAWLDEMIRAHYSHIGKSHWNYFYVDEMLAFMRQSRKNQVGAIQVITAGRELGHTFLGGTQRPFWIPTEAMSEMTKVYSFFMSMKKDKDRLWEIGLPEDFQIPTEYFAFSYYDKKSRKQCTLKLPKEMADRFGGPAPHK